MYLIGSGTSGNVVLGNLIGTDINGTANLGNTVSGVLIQNQATANTVGGTSSGAANVLSGNGTGVYLGGSGTSGNVVLGNLIGTDIHGTANLGNIAAVLIRNGATGNTVGGTSSGAANVISGNRLRRVSGWQRDEWQRGTGQSHRHRQERYRQARQHLRGVFIRITRRPTRWEARAAALPTSSPATPTLAFIWLAAGQVATWCWATSSAPTRTAPPISATPRRRVHPHGATGNTVGGTSSGAANVISGNTIRRLSG